MWCVRCERQGRSLSARIVSERTVRVFVTGTVLYIFKDRALELDDAQLLEGPVL